MIIVTGGAGFIGSNIIRALNKVGHHDIMVVDDLKKGCKFNNLVGLYISDYLDKTDFITLITDKTQLGNIQAIFHQGACSDTTQWDGKYMMGNNYQYSKVLLNYALKKHIPFLYASSAAVYGNKSDHFVETECHEHPITLYGYSKLLFDEYVRRVLPQARSPICGLRYFNVYGPHEHHKGKMASVVFHLYQQIKQGQNPRLFAGSETFKRDFIFIDDVVALNIWLWQQGISGIFNCGTGRAESFQTLGNAVTAHYPGHTIEYIPFPEALKGHYQTFTQANLTHLRRVGYDQPFKTVAQGVEAYLNWLDCTPYSSLVTC